MRHVAWVAIIVFGGGLAALMAAALILQHQAGQQPEGPKADLKTTVTGVRQALTHWQRDKLFQYTRDAHGLNLALTNWDHNDRRQPPGDLPEYAYQKMFDSVGIGEPLAVRKYKSLLSALDTFPSVVFPNMTVDSVAVDYEFIDAGSKVWLAALFVRDENDRFFMKRFRLDMGLKEGIDEPATFGESEDEVKLQDTVDRLFDSLFTGNLKEFRSVMALKEGISEKAARERLRGIQRKVMACDVKYRKYGPNLTRQMIPVLGPLSRGTRWFRFHVTGTVKSEIAEAELVMSMRFITGPPLRITTFDVQVYPSNAPAKGPAPRGAPQ